MSVILASSHPLGKVETSKVRAVPDVPRDSASFPRVPHRIMRDRRLSPTARVTACALEFFARTEAVCWPSNASLGEYVGIDPSNVKDALAELEKHEHIRRETVRPHRLNMTGRIIHLCWNQSNPAPRTLPDGVIAAIKGRGENAPPSASVQDVRMGRTHPGGWGEFAPGGGVNSPPKKEGALPRKKEENVTSPGPHDTISTSSKGAKGSAPDGKPFVLSEAIMDLAGKAEADALAVAIQISADLGDRKSSRSFLKKSLAVLNGAKDAPPKRLLFAWQEGIKAKAEGLDKPGAIFETAWKGWRDRESEDAADVRRKQEAQHARDQTQRAEWLAKKREQIGLMRSYESGLMIDQAGSSFDLFCELDAADALQIKTRSGDSPGPLQQEVIALLCGRKPQVIEALKVRREEMKRLGDSAARRAARFSRPASAVQGRGYEHSLAACYSASSRASQSIVR